jgi:methylmalonyl-CoA mutase
LLKEFDRVKMDLNPYHWETILNWGNVIEKYKNPIYTFKVRNKEINIETHSESLSQSQNPNLAEPTHHASGERIP